MISSSSHNSGSHGSTMNGSRRYMLLCTFTFAALIGIVFTLLNHRSEIEMMNREQMKLQITQAMGAGLSGEEEVIEGVSASGVYSHSKRNLALKIDQITGDSVVTYNGDVPETQCPVGKYRLPSTSDLQMVRGPRTDGCIFCPRGRYGSTTRLESKQCTAACPTGRYNDRLGATSVKDCRLCPTGKFGATQGLTTPKCSGTCSAGKYSGKTGVSRASDCKDCPVGYRGWQCDSWDNTPLKPSQLNRLNSGQSVTNPDRILE